MLRKKHNQNGFTLVEMLIAVIILSIGLLGLAGLQITSLKFNYSSEQRTQATILAYDMIDRMRANKTLAEAGSYDVAMGDGPAGSVDCRSAACNPASMATYDVNQWLCQLGSSDGAAGCLGITGLLLEGNGSVSRAGSTVTVTISWTDDRTKAVGDADRTSTLSVSTIL